MYGFLEAHSLGFIGRGFSQWEPYSDARFTMARWHVMAAGKSCSNRRRITLLTAEIRKHTPVAREIPLTPMSSFSFRSASALSRAFRSISVILAVATLSISTQAIAGEVITFGQTVGTNSPVLVNTSGVLAGKSIIAVSVGESHTLALASDGTVYSWGENNGGSLGTTLVPNGGFTSTPVAVDITGVLAGKQVTAIAAGLDYSLALTADGKIFSWGSNSFNQLGNGNSTDQPVPVALDMTGALSGKTVTAIAAGDEFAVALASDGTVYSWGYNQFGRLGVSPATSAASSPIAVDVSGVLSGKTITAIAAGRGFALVLSSDSKIFGWGIDADGEIGNGSVPMNSFTNAPLATDMSGVLSGLTVTAISCAGYHSLALASNGRVYAWGNDQEGQLGNSLYTAQELSPVAVDTAGVLAGVQVTQISAGNECSFALSSTGAVYSWGFNFSSLNQLGLPLVNGASVLRTNVPGAVDTSGVLSGTTVTALQSGSGGGEAQSSAVVAVPSGTAAPTITVQPANQSVNSGGTASFSVTASGSGLSYQWSFGPTPIAGATSSTLSFTATASSVGSYSVVVTNAGGSVVSSAANLTLSSIPAPVITAQPADQALSVGATASFSVTASGSGLSYQWFFGATPIPGATTPTLSFTATAATVGSYSVVVTNAGGSVASRSAALTTDVAATIVNVSVRAPAGAGENTLIAGFVLAGSSSSSVLVRGIGPALASFGVVGSLLDPQLTLYDGAGTPIGANSAWGGSATLSAAFASAGAFSLPAASKDAALLPELAPGPYTAQITGSNPVNGIALAEVYNVDISNPSARLVNVSGRAGNVGPGSHSLIAGFAISGAGKCHIVVRGVGPTLKTFGVASALANPVLSVYDSTGKIIASNDDWNGDATLVSDFASAGAFPLPLTSKDAALDLSLSPGTYTAVVTSADATQGTALVEMYLLK
jgi:alpha-tubulin suppressor-like RCC1 family protein